MDAVTILEMHALVTEFEGYLRDERMCSPRTISRYMKTMRDFVGVLGEQHGLNRFHLDKLKRADIVAFLRAASTRGAGPSKDAWNLSLSALRTFYQSLFESERIDVNPARRVRMKRVFRDKREPLTFEEMLRLADAAGAHTPLGLKARNLAIIKVFIHCGLRVAELASLCVDQVDYERTLFVGVQHKGDKHLSVVFNDVVQSALELYEPERVTLSRGQPMRELFLSKRGTAMSIRAVQEVISTAASRAGITRAVSPHVLRHSNADLLSKVGKATLDTIQKALGHESVETTQIYVHPCMDLWRQASRAMGKRWNKEEKEWKRHEKERAKVS